MLLASAAVFAEGPPVPDGIAVTAGYHGQARIYGVAAYWSSICSCNALARRGFDTRVSAQLAYWKSNMDSTEHPHLWEASLTPMLRWTAPPPGPEAFIAEGGVGVGALSSTRLGTRRDFGSAFQFNEQIGFGIAFDVHRRNEFVA
jgi:hypothetical protein